MKTDRQKITLLVDLYDVQALTNVCHSENHKKIKCLRASRKMLLIAGAFIMAGFIHASAIGTPGDSTNAVPSTPVLSGRMLPSGFQLEMTGGKGSYTLQSSIDPGFRDPQFVTNYEAGTNTFRFVESKAIQGSALYYRIVPNASGNVTNEPPVTNQVPVIVTQPKSTNVVVGGAATFHVTVTGTAPLSYQWFKNTQSNAIFAATNANYVISSVTSSNAGLYFVRAANPAGSVLSSNATLTVFTGTNQPPSTNQPPVTNAPVIILQPKSTNAVVGSAVTFSVTASGTTPLSYQWFKNSKSNAIFAATNANYVISSVTASNVGSYFVRVANPAGSILSSNATLTVFAGTNQPPSTNQPPITNAPVIILQPKSTNAAIDSAVTFSVTASGMAPLSYQWFKGITNSIGGATNNSYMIGSVTSSNAGVYFVRVANSAGSVLSSNATLTVFAGTNQPPSTNQPPITNAPVIILQPKSTNAVIGSVVTFHVSATGSALSYQWFKNSQSNAIFTATNANYVISSVTASNVGSYFVRVANPAGSVLSSNAVLTVFVGTNQPPPVTNPPVIIFQPSSTNAVLGSAVMFQVSATGSALSYQWFKDSQSNAIFAATNANCRISSITTSNAGSYFVRVANPAGLVLSSNAVLTVTGP